MTTRVSVLHRILPACIDNRYRGHPVALWLLVPITVQMFGMSLTHLFNADGGAQSISTMPLDTYPASAAQNIVGLMARNGIEQLVLGLLLVLVLIRYRAMIPLMYLLLAARYLVSRAVFQMKPLVLAGTSGVSTVALVIATLIAIGLVLSLTGRGYAEHASEGR